MFIFNHLTDLVGVGVAILAIVAVIIWILYRLKYTFTYPLLDSGMDIRFLGITLRRVLFSDIDDIEVISFTSLLPLSRSFRPDLFISLKWCGYNKRVVAIKRRTGLVKRIIVSPADPETFAGSLRAMTEGREGRAVN